MRGLAGRDGLELEPALRFVGPCVLRGELYDLGEYPGLRPGSGHVFAELHAVRDPDVFVRLDAFEGFDGSEPRASLYLRERWPLIEPRDATAWVYVYNRIPEAPGRILGGDWRAHRAAPPRS